MKSCIRRRAFSWGRMKQNGSLLSLSGKRQSCQISVTSRSLFIKWQQHWLQNLFTFFWTKIQVTKLSELPKGSWPKHRCQGDPWLWAAIDLENTKIQKVSPLKGCMLGVAQRVGAKDEVKRSLKGLQLEVGDRRASRGQVYMVVHMVTFHHFDFP